MTREDIIRMAREAGIEWDLIDEDEGQIWYISADGLERFAALVAAAERKRFAWTQEHWTEYERNIAAAAKAEEREACAKVCETEWSNVAERMYGEECAAAIRARSNT